MVLLILTASCPRSQLMSDWAKYKPRICQIPKSCAFRLVGFSGGWGCSSTTRDQEKLLSGIKQKVWVICWDWMEIRKTETETEGYTKTVSEENNQAWLLVLLMKYCSSFWESYVNGYAELEIPRGVPEATPKAFPLALLSLLWGHLEIYRFQLFHFPLMILKMVSLTNMIFISLFQKDGQNRKHNFDVAVIFMLWEQTPFFVWFLMTSFKNL